MRTDAKIGFSIGGVLLAVLIAYLLVNSHHNASSKTVKLASTAGSAENAAKPGPARADSSLGGSGGATDSNGIVVGPGAPPTGANTPVPPDDSANRLADKPADTRPGDRNLQDKTPSDKVPGDKIASDKTVDSHEPVVDGIFHSGSIKTGSDASDVPPDASSGVFVNGGMKLNTDIPSDTTAARTGDKSVAASSGKTLHGHGAHRSGGDVITAEKTESLAPHEIQIKPGQTLGKIASDVYGSSRFWVAIQRANPGIDSKHLKIGQTIKLPDVADVRPVLVDVDAAGGNKVIPANAADRTESTGHTDSAAAGDGVLTSDKKTYRVVSGDSLYKISKKLFGTGRRADDIYALNKSVIGDNKAKLKLGEVLQVPAETESLVVVR